MTYKDNTMHIIKKYLVSLIIACWSLGLAGCGPKYDFNRAKNLEKKGYFVEASVKYEKIAGKYRNNILSPEALYRSGRIYQNNLKLYSKAKLLYGKLLDEYPGAIPWKELAQEAMFNCPDYFPLTNGNFWIEGDSKTDGKNMRAEWSCKKISGDTYSVTRKIYSGSSFVLKINRYLKKEKMQLNEYRSLTDTKFTKILSYPFMEGTRWQTYKDGVLVRCSITSSDESVTVMAGKFEKCIKVSEKYENLPGSLKNNYYAPDIGWVLTTTSIVGGQEFRNSELMSYKINHENKYIESLPDTDLWQVYGKKLLSFVKSHIFRK